MTRTVLCFGDSNTHGTIALTKLGAFQRMDRTTRWPGQLGKALGDGWQLIEEGQPGRTTVHDDPIEGPHRNGLTVLPSLLESHRPIDLVLLMLGTNDLKPRFSVTPTDIALSVERLVHLITASASGPDGAAPKVVVIAPVPVKERGVLKEIFAGGSRKSDDLSLLYKSVAERTGCAFFDAGAVAEVDPIDGVHLDETAHGAIAQGLNELIIRTYS